MIRMIAPHSSTTTAPAPALGGDTDAILRGVLDLSPDDVTALREAGALG